ncbi:hypothetical protein HOY82DRAFT_539879 [Tuber indicum]|nr:hypothetical protein HOY82DRAFT_539879 [Tuber indicum]
MSTSTATELETNPDSSGSASNPSGSEEMEGSDRTQAMNFDSDIEWIAATHPRTGDMELESSSPTVRSSTHISENSNSPMEESKQSNPPSTLEGNTIVVPEGSQGIAANLPYPITNETIKALRYYAH